MKLAGDEHLRQDLIGRGQRRAKTFSAVRLADNHLEIFTEACGAFRRSEYIWNRWLQKYYDMVKLMYHVLLTRLRNRLKKMF